MLSRSSLLAGAALALLFVTGAHAQAAADGAKDAHVKRHVHHRVERRAEPAVQDNSAAMESEMASLREQLDQMKAAQQQQVTQNQAQMDQMRSELAQAQSAAQAAQAQLNTQIETIPGVVDKAVAAAAPKTDKLYYKGISITLGGFAAIESVYRSHNEGADIGSSFSGIPLPTTSASRTAEYRETARQSRFSLLAEGRVNQNVSIIGYGEFDFLGAAQTANSNESNSYQPRIRNLYAQIDWTQPFGAIEFVGGQNWSLATMYSKGLSPRNEQVPLTIEAQYVPGFVWARQPQMRLAADIDQHVWFAVSVENPQTTIFSSGKFLPGVSVVDQIVGGSEFNSANMLSLNKQPDVIGKVAVDENLEGHSLHAEAFGIYRDFYARLDTSGSFSNETAQGGGVGGGIILGAIPKILDLQVSGIDGRGIGRYGSGQLSDVSFGVNGVIKPIQEWMLLAGGTAHVGKTLDVYMYAGEERQSAQNYGTAAAFNGVGSVFENNSGCEVDAGTCGNSTHYIDQLTLGFWQRPYIGAFGRLQWGIQYSYTERHLFPGFGAAGAPSATTDFNPAPIARENMIFTSIRYYPF
jgi:hypothetical protein